MPHTDRQPPFIFSQDVMIPSLSEATTIRDRVVPAVEQKAEQTDPGFSAAARAFVLQHLRDHGRTSGEVLTLECKRAGILPPDDRAFGAVYGTLQRRGLIEKAGTVRRTRGRCAGGHLYILTATGRDGAA